MNADWVFVDKLWEVEMMEGIRWSMWCIIWLVCCIFFPSMYGIMCCICESCSVEVIFVLCRHYMMRLRLIVSQWDVLTWREHISNTSALVQISVNLDNGSWLYDFTGKDSSSELRKWNSSCARHFTRPNRLTCTLTQTHTHTHTQAYTYSQITGVAFGS